MAMVLLLFFVPLRLALAVFNSDDVVSLFIAVNVQVVPARHARVLKRLLLYVSANKCLAAEPSRDATPFGTPAATTKNDEYPLMTDAEPMLSVSQCDRQAQY